MSHATQNLSSNFQVYDGPKLVAEYPTLDKAREALKTLPLSCYIVYPLHELQALYGAARSGKALA